MLCPRRHLRKEAFELVMYGLTTDCHGPVVSLIFYFPATNPKLSLSRSTTISENLQYRCGSTRCLLRNT